MTSPRPPLDVAGLSDALGAPHTLVRELSGGMARVLVLRDESLGRLVACKVLDPSLAHELSAERFAREIRLAATLQNPHIVPLLRAGELHGIPWFTMPFVEGQSLRELMREKGPLPWREALPILRDVARALAYAHARDVVHRDIKPENVLITSDSAVVADFGVAKAVDRSRAQGGHPNESGGGTAYGMVVGTPAYMAPEQAAADPSTGAPADVYAWGLLAYEMFAGAPAFTAATAQEFLAAHLAKTPEPLGALVSNVPSELVDLVMQCLEKDPDARPTAATLVQRCEQPVVTSGDGLRAGGPATLKPSRILQTLGLAVAALLVVGVVGAWQWSRYQTAQAAESAAKERVYFAPFANRTGDSSLDGVGEIAADYLARALIESGLADAVGAFGEEVASDASSLKGAVRRGLGGMRSEAVSLGAGTLVEGAVYRLGDSLRFEARVIDARDGKLLRSIDPVRAPLSAGDKVLSVVADRVLGAIALYVNPDVRVIAGQTRRPPTFEAYRAFMTGVRIIGWDSTAYYHLRAAQIDTTFDYSLVRAARARYNAFRCEGVDSIADVLSPRRSRMTPFELASLDLYIQLCAGNKTGALDAARRMETIAPKSDYVQMEVIRATAATGAYEETVQRAERIDGTRGWFGATESASNQLFGTVLPAYYATDRMEDFKRLASRWPTRLARQRAEVLRAMLIAGILQDDCAALGRVLAMFNAMSTTEQAIAMGAHGWRWAGASGVIGCTEVGNAFAEATIRLADDIEQLAPDGPAKALVRIGTASASALLGRTADARRMLASVGGASLDSMPLSERYYVLTRMLHTSALAGDTAQTTALVAKYRALPRDPVAVDHAISLVFIGNALGHTDSASIALLEALRVDETRRGRLDAFLPLALEFRLAPGLEALREDPRVAKALGLRDSDTKAPQRAVPPDKP